MPWTSRCPSEGILAGNFADFLTAVLTLASCFSAFALALIEFARRVSFLSAAFSSFNVRVKSVAQGKRQVAIEGSVAVRITLKNTWLMLVRFSYK